MFMQGRCERLPGEGAPENTQRKRGSKPRGVGEREEPGPGTYKVRETRVVEQDEQGGETAEDEVRGDKGSRGPPYEHWLWEATRGF